MPWTRRFIIALLLSVTLLTQARVDAQQAPNDQPLLQWIAQRYSIPLERLRIAERMASDSASANTTLQTIKVLDTATGRTYLVALDA